jgi:hypothetical protein
MQWREGKVVPKGNMLNIARIPSELRVASGNATARQPGRRLIHKMLAGQKIPTLSEKICRPKDSCSYSICLPSTDILRVHSHVPMTGQFRFLLSILALPNAVHSGRHKQLWMGRRCRISKWGEWIIDSNAELALHAFVNSATAHLDEPHHSARYCPCSWDRARCHRQRIIWPPPFA